MTLEEILKQKKYSYEFNDRKITVTHRGNVDLRSLTTLPEDVRFNNAGLVDLDSLTTLPEGVQFNNQGIVYLDSLTTLPEGVQFNNQGDIELYSLHTLPEGVQFNNQGIVYLGSLIPEKQLYRGKEITLRIVDIYTMLIESEKTIKGITIYKARYFGGGEIENLEKCYVAKVGRHWAHGKTLKEAIEDATEKAVLSADIADVVDEIKRTGMVTIAQYRAITGACREGCRQFLKSIGKPDATALLIEEVKEKAKGQYGYERFIEAI